METKATDLFLRESEGCAQQTYTFIASRIHCLKLDQLSNALLVKRNIISNIA